MKLLILVSICSCLAITAWAQQTPCVSPPLLVGGIGIEANDGTFLAAGKYAYDAVREMIRFQDFGENGTQHFSVDILMQFKEGVVYQIDRTKSTCKKMPLKSSFHPLRIPTNARFLSEVILGTTSIPQEGLQITSWAGELTDMQEKYVLTFTTFTCLPVSAVVNTKEYGWMAISFFNQLLGIQDPMVFVPPVYCETATVENNPADFFSVLHQH